MYKFLIKNGQVVAFGLGLLLVLVYFLSVGKGLPADFSSLEVKDQLAANTSAFNFGLKAAIVLIVLTAIVVIGFMIYQFISNPKGAIKGLIAIAVLAVLFLILYSSADPAISPRLVKDFPISDGISKYISAALSTTLIVGAFAIFALIASEVRSFFQ